ncbi:MAG: TlpA family protein disulfide reductase [Deltaproteobacteria bacterium]|nr:TlpA family protein disulfide reductase [Deltaproteobacteria bacterium]
MNWADFPSVARGADGTILAHYAQKSSPSAYSYDVMLVRSADDGTTWKSLGRAHDDNTPTEHGFVTLVAQEKGVRAFWLDGRETAGEDGHEGTGAMTLRTALVGEDGVMAGELLDPRVCDCCGTSAAVTSEGPVVVYRNRGEDETRDIWIIGREETGWRTPHPVHADGWKIAGCPVNGPAVAARERRVVVAWYTYAGDRPSIRVAFSDNAGRSFDRPMEVDRPFGKRAPIGRVDVILDERGEAIVSWIAAERDDAMVLARRVTRERRMSEARPLLSTRAGRNSGFPRMDRLGDSLLLAWTDAASPSQVRAELRTAADLPPVSLDATEVNGTTSDLATGLLAAGQPAPTISAVDLDGKDVDPGHLRKGVVLLTIWATWCEPCRQEQPVLSALMRQYGEKGLKIVGLSVDQHLATQELATIVARRKIPYTTWHDRMDRASQALGVGTLPAAFLIEDGIVRWRQAGTVKAGDPELTTALAKALAPRPVRAEQGSRGPVPPARSQKPGSGRGPLLPRR